MDQAATKQKVDTGQDLVQDGTELRLGGVDRCLAEMLEGDGQKLRNEEVARLRAGVEPKTFDNIWMAEVAEALRLEMDRIIRGSLDAVDVTTATEEPNCRQYLLP